MAVGVYVMVLLASSLLAEVTSAFVEVRINITKPLTAVDDHFVGVTLDSLLLPITANLKGLDFSSPKVQLLAKALSPSYLRVGGTLGDLITFDPTGHSGGSKNVTFTGETWDKLNTFVRTVGWDLIFGLNVLKRRGLEWDPTNAKELLNYSLNKKYTFAGLELGNEPQFFPGLPRGAISGGQLGRDFMTLKNIMRAIPSLNSTLLLGTDSTGLTGGNAEIFQEFFVGIGTLVLDRITVHQYYGYAGSATVAMCLDPSTMDAFGSLINTVYAVTKVSNPNTPVWLGETSSFWGGGAQNISDRYVAGFLWLDKLGIAAKMGIKAVLRQSFYGQNYSLIDMNTNGFDPHPDYWLTLLYKRLVGNNVLNVRLDGVGNMRVYAHCTNNKSPYGYPAGSVTVYYLNVNQAASTTNIELPQFESKVMLIYSLTPGNGNVTDKSVALNGKKLEIINNTLPDMEPIKSTVGFVTTQTNTFGFVVIPDADLDICKM